jgi:hypothetical protein
MTAPAPYIRPGLNRALKVTFPMQLGPSPLAGARFTGDATSENCKPAQPMKRPCR